MKKKKKVTKIKKKPAVKKPSKKKTVKKTSKKVTKKKASVKKQKTSKLKKEIVSKTSAKSSSGAGLEEVGVITHYFPHVEAAVVKLTKSFLNVGDVIVVKGHTTDFEEKVNSLQLEHVSITTASIGQEIGLRVKNKVREHDVVYKVTG
jgi:hypothetical protein